MVAKPAPIDISDRPELVALVEQLLAAGEPRELRRGDEVLGVLKPPAKPPRRRVRRPSAEDIAAFESAAGGWADNVDVDRFLAENAQARRASVRPPVQL